MKKQTKSSWEELKKQVADYLTVRFNKEVTYEEDAEDILMICRETIATEIQKAVEEEKKKKKLGYGCIKCGERVMVLCNKCSIETLKEYSHFDEMLKPKQSI